MNNHIIIIADEKGMASVFPRFKEIITEAPTTTVTILYHSQNDYFLFRKELDIMERHFPARLYVSYECSTSGSSTLNQAAIEAVINANTIPVMNFIISGSQAFTEKSKKALDFLGVQNIQIQEQFFTSL